MMQLSPQEHHEAHLRLLQHSLVSLQMVLLLIFVKIFPLIFKEFKNPSFLYTCNSHSSVRMIKTSFFFKRCRQSQIASSDLYERVIEHD